MYIELQDRGLAEYVSYRERTLTYGYLKIAKIKEHLTLECFAWEHDAWF